MRILITTPIYPPEIGGPATYISQLVPRLKPHHHLTIITFCSKPPQTIPGVNLIHIPTHSHSLTRQLSLLSATTKAALSHDLIYTQGTLVVGFTSVLASIFTRTPLLLKYVGDEPWETAISAGHTTLSLPLFYRHLSLCYLPHILFTRFSLLAAKHVITPSQRLKSTLSSIHPLLPSRITVIPNAVDTKPLSLKKRPFQLIFVGRLVPWKHVDLIIQAVSIARSKSHPWKLHLVGTGPQLASLKRQVTRLRAKSWIKFHHNLTRPATHRLIAQSQALLLYSSYEGLSHTAIEAMLLGTHIIASNIPANREVLGPSAQLVSLNSPKNLAHAINHPKPHLDANQKRAQSLYSWNNHLHSLTKLFSSLS